MSSQDNKLKNGIEEESLGKTSVEQSTFQLLSTDRCKKIKRTDNKESCEQSEGEAFRDKIDESKKRGPYRKYTTDIRNEAIALSHDLGNPGKAAQNLKIPIKNLRRWLIKGPNRKSGGGRRSHDPEMESRLVKWTYEYLKVHGQLPSHTDAKTMAIESSVTDHPFKASKGWYEKFLKRHFREQKLGSRVYKQGNTGKTQAKVSQSNAPIILPVVHSPNSGIRYASKVQPEKMEMYWGKAFKRPGFQSSNPVNDLLKPFDPFVPNYSGLEGSSVADSPSGGDNCKT